MSAPTNHSAHSPEADRHEAELARPAAIDALTLSRMPERDLWPGIAQRLPRRRRERSQHWLPVALAASLVLALVGGLQLRGPVQTLPPEAASTGALVASPVQPSSAAVERDWTDVELRTVSISARSLRTLRGGVEGLDLPLATGTDDENFMKAAYRPGIGFGKPTASQQSLLRAHLKLITQAEREVRRALRSDPESENLRELLETAEAKREHLKALIAADHE